MAQGSEPLEPKEKARKSFSAAYQAQLARTRELKSQRVDIIADRMTRLEWRGRPSVKELAAEWSLDEGTVRNIAAEAARMAARELGDPDEVRARCYGSLDRIREEALQSDDPKDRRNAIEAIKAMALIAGVMAPQRLDVRHELATLPDEEVERRYLALKARVQAETVPLLGTASGNPAISDATFEELNSGGAEVAPHRDGPEPTPPHVAIDDSDGEK